MEAKFIFLISLISSLSGKPLNYYKLSNMYLYLDSFIAIVLSIDTLNYGICGFIIDSSLVNNLNNHGK